MAFIYTIPAGSSEPEHSSTGTWHPVHNQLILQETRSERTNSPTEPRYTPSPTSSFRPTTRPYTGQQILPPDKLRILDLNAYSHGRKMYSLLEHPCSQTYHATKTLDPYPLLARLTPRGFHPTLSANSNIDVLHTYAIRL